MGVAVGMSRRQSSSMDCSDVAKAEIAGLVQTTLSGAQTPDTKRRQLAID